MALYVKIPHCCLFIPQSYLKDYNDYSKLAMYNNNKFLSKFGKNKRVLVPYDTTTLLPILIYDKDVTNTDELFYLCAWTTDEQNTNLTYIYKNLLKWHFHIGNIGLQQLQCIARE